MLVFAKARDRLAVFANLTSHQRIHSGHVTMHLCRKRRVSSAHSSSWLGVVCGCGRQKGRSRQGAVSSSLHEQALCLQSRDFELQYFRATIIGGRPKRKYCAALERAGQVLPKELRCLSWRLRRTRLPPAAPIFGRQSTRSWPPCARALPAVSWLANSKSSGSLLATGSCAAKPTIASASQAAQCRVVAMHPRLRHRLARLDALCSHDDFRLAWVQPRPTGVLREGVRRLQFRGIRWPRATPKHLTSCSPPPNNKNSTSRLQAECATFASGAGTGRDSANARPRVCGLFFCQHPEYVALAQLRLMDGPPRAG